MSGASYQSLAASYDALTGDVGYEQRAAFLQRLFARAERKVTRVLDLACGTGSITLLLSRAGYELVGVDASPDMLAQARAKFDDRPPLLLCQPMQRLSLGSEGVDAAVCCLDSINYLTRPQDVQSTFRRVYESLNEGGVFVFDVHSVQKMAALDGQVWLDETDDVYCVWRTEFRPRAGMLDYWVDLFTRGGTGTWRRSMEEHHQRAYPVDELCAWLHEAGFAHVKTHGDCRLRAPREGEGRIYFSCIKREQKHG